MQKRTALVTGGTRGIGAAIAAKLSDSGYDVIAPSRKDMELSDDRSIDAYIAALHVPVDVLVNNAGINILAGYDDITDETLVKTLQVNLTAPLRLIRRLAPLMVERRYGRILNISSIWGTITKPRRIPYTMSKSALDGMTRTVAVELAPHNVLVNALAPGYVNTELTRQNNSPADIVQIEKNIPIGRMALPEEIADVAAFLVSDRNTYITGQVIMADGGFTCL